MLAVTLFVGMTPIFVLSGCRTTGMPTVVEIEAKSAPTRLTPARGRLSDDVLRTDLALFGRVRRQAEQLLITSTARAEAETWIEAARAEYLAGSWHPWVEAAVARAQALVATRDNSAVATEPELAAASLRALDSWIAHVRATRGFRSALPLLARAESLRASAGISAAVHAMVDQRPDDLPESLFDLQSRLAALHDLRGVSVRSYAWAKAQAWLDLALDTHFIRDRSGIVGAAAEHARKIITLLEGSADRAELAATAVQTPPLGAAAREPEFRADLWRSAVVARPTDLSARVTEPASTLATLAQLEVALIHAAHEHGQRGWRGSWPFQQTAARLAASLSNAAP